MDGPGEAGEEKREATGEQEQGEERKLSGSPRLSDSTYCLWSGFDANLATAVKVKGAQARLDRYVPR
jgi:hypothetical protein